MQLETAIAQVLVSFVMLKFISEFLSPVGGACECRSTCMCYIVPYMIALGKVTFSMLVISTLWTLTNNIVWYSQHWSVASTHGQEKCHDDKALSRITAPQKELAHGILFT